MIVQSSVIVCLAMAIPMYGRPLEEADVVSLLPATPRTTNETVAAIVQDPVVKDAVQYAVGNGSLSGLVVKKNIVIIPASAPDTILTHRQQILVAPVSHLDDIRKNITEDLNGNNNSSQEMDEVESSSWDTFVYEPTAEDDYEMEENVVVGPTLVSAKLSIYINKNLTLNGSADAPNVTANEILPKIEPKAALPEGTVTKKLKLPEPLEKKVSLPVVAVLNPSKTIDHKVESSLVALLPGTNNGHENSIDEPTNQLEYLKNNSGRIQEEAQELIDQTAMAVDPNTGTIYLGAEEGSPSPSSRSEETIAWTPETRDSKESYVIPLTLAMAGWPLGAIHSRATKDRAEYANGEGMETAEDIVFRPLFRFRQEAERRANYRAAEAYRRSSYRRYDPYGSYDSYRRPSYRYRSSNNDYNDY